MLHNPGVAAESPIEERRPRMVDAKAKTPTWPGAPNGADLPRRAKRCFHERLAFHWRKKADPTLDVSTSPILAGEVGTN